MTIEEEGDIRILPDGTVLVEGFTVKYGTTHDLQRLAEHRVLMAADRIKRAVAPQELTP